MCVAIPAKIIEIQGNTATADIMGNKFEANISLVDAKLDDYILIHAGFAIEVMQKDQAEEMLDIFGELEEVVRDDVGRDHP